MKHLRKIYESSKDVTHTGLGEEKIYEERAFYNVITKW
jgi:hypothetical protein